MRIVKERGESAKLIKSIDNANGISIPNNKNG